MRTVGVISSALVPPFVRDLLDVCFNPLSAVLKALSDQCVGAGCTHVVVVPVDDFATDKATNARSHSPGVRVRALDVANGLLFLYGISSTTESLDAVDNLRASSGEDVVVVVMAEKAASALAASKKLAGNGTLQRVRHCALFHVNNAMTSSRGYPRQVPLISTTGASL